MNLFGSTSTSTTVPKWQSRAIQDAIRASYKVANLGFTPYYGPDVAAMTPMQMAAMQGTNQALSAFGMPTADLTAGMPEAQNYNGMMAYSSGDMYDQALLELRRRNPEQYNALMNLQFTRSRGKGGGNSGGGNSGGGNSGGGNSGGGNSNSNSNLGNGGNTSSGNNSNTGGGYTSVRDMFDGGGAGQSGNTFSGGPLSGTLNDWGVQPLRPITPAPVSTPTPVSTPAPVNRPPVVTRPRSEYF